MIPDWLYYSAVTSGAILQALMFALGVRYERARQKRKSSVSSETKTVGD